MNLVTYQKDENGNVTEIIYTVVDQIVMVDSLEEAVNYAADHAEEGDAVLLSPACASWGMFKNYEVRGDQFKEFVHRLS